MAKLINIFLIMLWGFIPGYALAGQLPDYYPKEFNYTGEIQSLKISEGHITIHGIQFKLSPFVTVYSPSSKNDSVLSLKPGTKIGYNFIYIDNKTRQIREIWMLPRDYKMPDAG